MNRFTTGGAVFSAGAGRYFVPLAIILLVAIAGLAITTRILEGKGNRHFVSHIYIGLVFVLFLLRLAYVFIHW